MELLAEEPDNRSAAPSCLGGLTVTVGELLARPLALGDVGIAFLIEFILSCESASSGILLGPG